MSSSTDYNEWDIPSFHSNKNILKSSSPIEKSLPTVDEVKSIYEKAYEEGLNKGYKEGIDKSRSEISAQMTIINNILTKLSMPYDSLSDDILEKLKEMCIVISSQIIRREISINDDNVMSAVKRSIELLNVNNSDTVILLNPLDVSIVKDILHDDIVDKLIIREDLSISRGGCKLISNASTIDATIEEQIRIISSKIIGGSRLEDA